jgi:hypothetical protein
VTDPYRSILGYLDRLWTEFGVYFGKAGDMYRNTGLDIIEVEVEVEVNLRPTVSRPVRLGFGPPYGTLDQILSCSSFFC